ncbi:hypothetical protein JOE63_002335 [Cellulosimicrobium cellulans]|jgi:hypothetical protein|uniref:DNA-binding protein n=1 Tax=Cellulosimicrobium cellulans TaxID=1710 RepID=A0A1Y0HYL3_CELCE|nr:hypothetical protein [Cellulosimicrobium cellulans]ARU53080.1 hypothetical protein CBR64_18200 [Cellulosimicrobium cellulans]MBM7819858.1 hypothetical protein [Cellulosimicrobium cellulans]
MFVLTVDQRGSTGHPDRVPEVLARLGELLDGRPGVVVPFDRTVGDEVQGVLGDAGTVVDVVLDLLRDGGWSVGVGAGSVDEPLPAVSREASGEAFVRAREAVEQAKSRAATAPVAVRGEPSARAAEVEALLRLLAAVVERRTAPGWEAVDTLARVGGTQKDVARVLGVSEQAVSQRLRVALWPEEAAVRPVVARLLGELRSSRQGEPFEDPREGGR